MTIRPETFGEVGLFRSLAPVIVAETFGPTIGLLAIMLSATIASPSFAQTNIDQGKTPAELFANDCAACHKSTRGLANGENSLSLSVFLREHYTASRDQAAALAAYVLANGGNAPAPKPAVDHARGEEPKNQEHKGQEAKGQEPKAPETKGQEAKGQGQELRGPELKGQEAKSQESKSQDSRSQDSRETRTPEPKVQEAKTPPPVQPEPASAAAAPASSESSPGPTTSAAAPGDSEPNDNAPVPRDNIPD
jgi:outer membrane biosynthesis protein TonB